MRKEEKTKAIDSLVEQINSSAHLYLTDISVYVNMNLDITSSIPLSLLTVSFRG